MRAASWSSERTSAWMNSAVAPSSLSSSASAWPASLCRPETTTVAPACAKVTAVARPMPVRAPVIMTTGWCIRQAFPRLGESGGDDGFETAIDLQDGAVDVAGGRGGQEDHRLGDLLGGGRPVERERATECLGHVAVDGGAGCPGGPGRDRIDPDALGPEFVR